MKSILSKITAAAVATVMTVGTVGLAVSDAEAKKVRWKMHSAFGKNVAVIGPVGYRIADMIREMSGGDFDIKVFEPGALAGGYAYYDPVSQGAFEAGYGTPGANQGKNSAFAFASTWPFGPGALEFNSWLINGGGVDLIADLYARDNIKFFYCGMIPPETSGWFREPIESLDQLRGLKMRFFGMGAKVMQKFGVATQQLAGGDIYPALELGTITRQNSLCLQLTVLSVSTRLLSTTTSLAGTSSQQLTKSSLTWTNGTSFQIRTKPFSKQLVRQTSLTSLQMVNPCRRPLCSRTRKMASKT